MNKNEKIVLLAEIHILPGFEQEVLNAAKKQLAGTRKEKGNEVFILTTEKENESVIRFFEIFSNTAAFELHKNEPHTKAFGEVLEGKVKDNSIKLTFLQQHEDL